MDNGINSRQEKNFWALDWLRFILAVYLVLYHTLRNRYEALGDGWLNAALGLGNLGTSLFFVLSGFLLTHAYVVTKNGKPLDKRKFYVARFSTLYPLHIVALLVALGPIAIAIYTKGGISVPVVPSGPPERMLGHAEFALALLTNVTMLNAWNPFYLSINIPSWSLSALAFFYLVFPVAARNIFRSRSPGMLLFLLGVLFMLPGLIADLLHRTDMFTDGLLHHNPVIRLPLFIAGIALCVLFSRTGPAGKPGLSLLAAVATVVTLVAGIYLQFHDVHRHIIRNGMYFPASIAVIWLCARVPSIPAGKIRYWGSRLGAVSLPLFFLHVPIFVIFVKVEKALVLLSSGRFSASSIGASGRDIEQSLLFYPVYLIGLIIVCMVVQERFVMPVQARIRQRFAERPAAVPAASKQASAG